MLQPKLVGTWKELMECKSDTHELVIDLYFGCGWIRPKSSFSIPHEETFKHNFYLSTHTFYELHYQHSTEVLQKCGFHVQLKNWDGETIAYKEEKDNE